MDRFKLMRRAVFSALAVSRRMPVRVSTEPDGTGWAAHYSVELQLAAGVYDLDAVEACVAHDLVEVRESLSAEGFRAFFQRVVRMLLKEGKLLPLRMVPITKAKPAGHERIVRQARKLYLDCGDGPLRFVTRAAQVDPATEKESRKSGTE